MTSDGKKARMKRIIDPETETSIILPLDHGSFIGPINGTQNPKKTVKKITESGANSVLGLKGLVREVLPVLEKDIGTIFQITCTTTNSPNPNRISKTISVKDALSLGADAVSAFITIENKWEKQNLEILGEISEGCDELGVPLLAMMEEPMSKDQGEKEKLRYLKHACRLGAEFGADIVKTTYPGSKEYMDEIINACSVPIVVAGGPKMEKERKLLQMVKDSMDAGATGTSIGRNLFQHENPRAMTKAIKKIVEEESDVEDAIQILNN